MSLVSNSNAKGLPRELSGPGDPLRVAIAHVLDLEEGTLSLRFSIGNRMTNELKNIVVRCSPGSSDVWIRIAQCSTTALLIRQMVILSACCFLVPQRDKQQEATACKALTSRLL